MCLPTLLVVPLANATMSVRLRSLRKGSLFLFELGYSVYMTCCASANAPLEFVFVVMNIGWLSAAMTWCRLGSSFPSRVVILGGIRVAFLLWFLVVSSPILSTIVLLCSLVLDIMCMFRVRRVLCLFCW